MSHMINMDSLRTAPYCQPKRESQADSEPQGVLPELEPASHDAANDGSRCNTQYGAGCADRKDAARAQRDRGQ